MMGRFHVSLALSTLLLLSSLFHNVTCWVGETSTSTTDPIDWELTPSEFGTKGRLFAVDLAMRAAEDESSTVVIAICCRDGVVVVSSLPTSPYLAGLKEDNDSENEEKVGLESGATGKAKGTKHEEEGTETKGGTGGEHGEFLRDDPLDDLLLNYHQVGVKPTIMPPFSRIRDLGFAVTAGNPIDSQLLHEYIQQLVRKQKQYSATAPILARQLADYMQESTQTMQSSALKRASVVLWDKKQPKKIWRIDPTGQFWLCRAVVAGRCARATEKILLEDKRFTESISAEEAIVLARDCIATSFKKSKLPRLTALVTKGGSDEPDMYVHREILDL